MENAVISPSMPRAVRDIVGFHINRLQDVARSLDNVIAARGKGYILSLELRDKLPIIKSSLDKLAEITGMAKQNGVDMNAVIELYGTVPDFDHYGMPAPVVADALFQTDFLTTLVNLGWQNQDISSRRAIYYVTREISGGIKWMLDKRGIRRVTAKLSEGRMLAMHGDGALVEMAYDINVSVEINAQRFHDGVSQIHIAMDKKLFD